jgi:hypothetical protein
MAIEEVRGQEVLASMDPQFQLALQEQVHKHVPMLDDLLAATKAKALLDFSESPLPPGLQLRPQAPVGWRLAMQAARTRAGAEFNARPENPHGHDELLVIHATILDWWKNLPSWRAALGNPQTRDQLLMKLARSLLANIQSGSAPIPET